MRFLALFALMAFAVSIQFSINVPPRDVRCFYQHLDYQAKFSAEVTPMDASEYQFFVQLVDSEDYLYHKKSSHSLDSISLSKFAPQANYYGFCIRNLISTPMNTIFKLESGIELMELSLLPNHSDNEYLNTQIQYLEKQRDDLFHILQNLEGSKQYTETLTNMMGTKAIWFALVGLVAIIAVNFGFYKEIRRTLKQRKLI